MEKTPYIISDADKETEPIGDRKVVQHFDTPGNDIVSCLVILEHGSELDSRKAERPLKQPYCIPIRPGTTSSKVPVHTLKDGAS